MVKKEFNHEVRRDLMIEAGITNHGQRITQMMPVYDDGRSYPLEEW